MTTSSKNTPAATPPGRIRRRTTTAIVALLVVGGISWFAWQRLAPDPPLPEFPPGSDPEVVQALESARRDVRLWPWSAERWGRLGMLLMGHDFYDEALACFAEAERLDPGNVRWPYYAGMIVLVRKADDSLPFFQRAMSRKPEFATRQRYAEALMSQDRLDEAEVVYRQSALAEPYNPFVLLGLAEVTLKQGKAKDALAQLSRLTGDPNVRKAAYRLLVDVQQQLGDGEAAALAAKRYAELPDQPPWPDPYITELQTMGLGAVGRVSRAIRLLGDGRVREAIQVLEETVATYPDNMQARLTLVKAYTQVNDTAAAERHAREALRLEPANSPAHILLARLLESKGAIDEALKHYKEAVKSKPDSFSAYYSIGQCSLRKGDKQAAEAAFREVIRIKPDMPDGHMQLATVLVKEGRDAEALKCVDDALRLAPENAQAKKLREEIAARLGKQP